MTLRYKLPVFRGRRRSQRAQPRAELTTVYAEVNFSRWICCPGTFHAHGAAKFKLQLHVCKPSTHPKQKCQYSMGMIIVQEACLQSLLGRSQRRCALVCGAQIWVRLDVDKISRCPMQTDTLPHSKGPVAEACEVLKL